MIGSRRAWRVLASVLLAFLAGAILEQRTRAQESAASLSSSFKRAAARARGSLVSIRIPEGNLAPGPYVPARPGRIGPLPGLSPFYDRQADGEVRMSFTGLVIDGDRGLILTSDPPTLGASLLIVTFPDGHERMTTQIRRDPRTGLALLVVDSQGLRPTPVRWGNPAKLEAGDWLLALGQPGVGDPSLSVGVFSTRRRGGGEELLETDAAITRVGAGGILVNLDGEVVGICRLGGRRADGLEGMGHAIPADRARRVAEDLGRFGQVRRAYLGVTVEPARRAGDGRQGPAAGVRVVSVTPNTPAADAGIRPGDLILAVGQRQVDSVASVQEAVESVPIGEETTLAMERQGKRMEVKLKPRVGPAAAAGPARTPRPGTTAEPGRAPGDGRFSLPGLSPPPGPDVPGTGPPLSPPTPPDTPSRPPES